MRKNRFILPILLFFTILIMSGCNSVLIKPGISGGDSESESTPVINVDNSSSIAGSNEVFLLSDIPAFDGSAAYITINGNVPYFNEHDLAADAFENYSPLDSLGRCGVAFANVCIETMPTEERGSISSVRPAGWKSAKYDCVDGKYLYNRCHLIGYQLTAENANEQNLITGTRYLNIQGMLPFENMVADYIKEEQNNHVLYRVTPIFEGTNLVAAGVLMEGYSVEDNGDGICFCVYAYNNQPGVEIDYATGESWEIEKASNPGVDKTELYIANTNSKKFHSPACTNAEKISKSNRWEFTGARNDLIAQGYEPCGLCKP